MNSAFFDDTLINRAGRYALSSGEQVEIDVSPDKVVRFRLIDVHGEAKFESTERASAIQRWDLYRDSNGSRLWFNSSDVGMTVWAKDQSDRYVQSWISDQTPTWAAKMPKPFFDALPKKLQQQWASFRNPER